VIFPEVDNETVRAPMVLIESDAQGPLGWFKLTWDGRGDMDLNLDVRAPGGHIGWDNPLSLIRGIIFSEKNT